MGMMTRRNVKARAAQTAPAETKVEEKVEVKAEPTLSEKVKGSGLTKTEINKMTTAELQELAKSFGVKDAAEMSGNHIKKILNGAMED